MPIQHTTVLEAEDLPQSHLVQHKHKRNSLLHTSTDFSLDGLAHSLCIVLWMRGTVSWWLSHNRIEWRDERQIQDDYAATKWIADSWLITFFGYSHPEWFPSCTTFVLRGHWDLWCTEAPPVIYWNAPCIRVLNRFIFIGQSKINSRSQLNTRYYNFNILMNNQQCIYITISCQSLKYNICT